MGRLAIKKIIYKGDNYYYSSKDLKMGIQIIEAENGAGKTTFSSFISYGLGMYVKQFDFKTKNENHIEIYNDTNNYVLLKILINGHPYELTRYFNPKNNNIIFIKGKDLEESYYIYRNAALKEEDMIFSDWILNKLGIEVCEIYQGVKKFKINFSDLFRLIHYDQETSAKKIYKEHRNDNNFVSDSNAVRKVIFELLVGQKFSDYYSLVGDYNKTEREKNTYKSTIDNYKEMIERMGYSIKNLVKEDLLKEIKSNKLQIDKLESYKELLKAKKYKTTNYDNYIKELREGMFNLEGKYLNLISYRKLTSHELRDLLKLKEELILEATQIKKIILAHEELNLFSPNTCPTCLRKVKRKKDHCICGNPINESQYEKFFYSADEYLDILKSKQKSEETIQTAIESCQEELDALDNQISQTELNKNKIKNELYELEENIDSVSNDNEINGIIDQILELKEEIQALEQKINVVTQFDEINKDYNNAKDKLATLFNKLRIMEKEVEKLMNEQVKEFNKIYSKLLRSADNNVHNAELDENYIPLVNNGAYRQASSYVPRRFLYYLTLMKMSVDINNVPFPKFLLIDTPENLGIDEENLVKCISLLDEVYNDSKTVQGYEKEYTKSQTGNFSGSKKKPDFQIILTTGLKKYPAKYESLVVETLTLGKKLLNKIE